MRFQYNPYIWPLMLSAAITMSLGIFALLRRRDTKYSVSFSASMFVVTIWSAGNALEMSGSDFSTKLLFANIQYFAYCYSPVALLILCMRFTGYDKWLKNRKALLLAALPTVSIILVWTDKLHGLMRYNMRMDFSGAFPVIAKEYGPFFYVHAAYSHMLDIFAILMLVGAVFHRKTVYRKQAAALLIGASMIFIPNVLYIAGLAPVKHFDITPLFFGPAGVLMYWSIFKYKMFDLMPIAFAAVVETMDSGVMVMDLQGRVLDMNPVFEKLTGYSVSQAVARNADEVCKNIPELSAACVDRGVARVEFSLEINKAVRFYMALLSPVADSNNIFIGRLILIHDITDKKESEQRLLEQQRQLAVNEERERMAMDLHDNLGQVLGFINLQAQGIRRELVNAGVDIGLQRLDKLTRTAQTAHDGIRTFIREARGTALTEKEFMASLGNHISEFEEAAGIEARLSVPRGFSADGLEPAARLNTMYIIREALNNVQKHAQAKHVNIKLTVQGRELCIVVEDDGTGFDISQNVIGRNSFGLNIMRERAVLMGGKLVIDSSLGEGTRIIIHIPYTDGGNTCEADAGR